jgi:tetratricopeptide (TPR) repeat protein
MLDPENAAANNNLAWWLASVPDDPWYDPAQGLGLAQKAVGIAPDQWTYLNTLGVAAYRMRDWKTATEVLHRSVTINGGAADDMFFLAMAYWQQGSKKEAREFYDRAVAWTEKYKPRDIELRRIREETEAVLGNGCAKPTPDKAPRKGGKVAQPKSGQSPLSLAKTTNPLAGMTTLAEAGRL